MNVKCKINCCSSIFSLPLLHDIPLCYLQSTLCSSFRFESKYEHKGKAHFVCGFEVAMVEISSADRAPNSQRIPGLLYTRAPIRELFTENVQYPGAMATATMVTTKLKVEKCTPGGRAFTRN